MIPLAPRGALLDWLASLPPADRDRRFDEALGLGKPPPPTSPGEHLVGHHPSGFDAVVRALTAVPVTQHDVFVDLGSGLGRVVLLAFLLTGARARGIEIQPALVERARSAAARIGADVRFDCADARTADLDDGTVFYLYAPFTGPVLAAVLERLGALAERRRFVVCALGIDLARDARWLAPRTSDDFWLTIYDVR